MENDSMSHEAMEITATGANNMTVSNLIIRSSTVWGPAGSLVSLERGMVTVTSSLIASDNSVLNNSIQVANNTNFVLGTNAMGYLNTNTIGIHMFECSGNCALGDTIVADGNSMNGSMIYVNGTISASNISVYNTAIYDGSYLIELAMGLDLFWMN